MRSFSEIQVNLNGLRKKPDITYPSRNSQNRISWAKLFWKPRTMLKIIYFNGGHQFFQKSVEIKLLYVWGRIFFIYWPGRHSLGPGRHFQQNYHLGKPMWHISMRNLDRVERLWSNTAANLLKEILFFSILEAVFCIEHLLLSNGC